MFSFPLAGLNVHWTKMAKVFTTSPRQQEPHYGLYKASSGGDIDTAIRRQLPLEQDYVHPSSRKLSDQRDRLTVASKHWNVLTPSEKLKWRCKLGYGYRSSSPQTETLLSGRQLFISQDLCSLLSKGELMELPFEVCIILCDENHNPLVGQLYGFYYEAVAHFEQPEDYEQIILEAWDDTGQPFDYGWHLCPAREIRPGSWLVTDIPKGKEAYRVRGAAPFYYDPHLPESESMAEAQLKVYHYHVLLSALALVIIEPWDTGLFPPLGHLLVIEEPWSEGEFTPPEYSILIQELWDEGEFPPLPYTILIQEWWDTGEFPPLPYTILIQEWWDTGEFSPLPYTILIQEWWGTGELPPLPYTILIQEWWDTGVFPPTIPPPWKPGYQFKIHEWWTS